MLNVTLQRYNSNHYKIYAAAAGLSGNVLSFCSCRPFGVTERDIVVKLTVAALKEDEKEEPAPCQIEICHLLAIRCRCRRRQFIR